MLPNAPKTLAEALGIKDGPMDEPEPEPTTAQEFAIRILNSPEYRKSVEQRILLGELPPAVECWLLNTAYGKPPDRVDIKTTTLAIDEVALSQAAERISFLQDTIARQKAARDAMDDEQLSALGVH